MMCTGAFQQQVFQPAKNPRCFSLYVTQYHALCRITCLPAVIFSGDEINNGLNESRGGRGVGGVWGVQFHARAGDFLL